jgi:hypothetical protein
VFWGFIALLAVVQIGENFGPQPSSSQTMAITAFIFYGVLALLAALVERGTIP